MSDHDPIRPDPRHPRRSRLAMSPTDAADATEREGARRSIEPELSRLDPTTARLVRDFLRKQKTGYTEGGYTFAVRELLRYCEQNDIDVLGMTKREASLFVPFISRLKQGTRFVVVGAIRSLYETLVEWDAVPASPFARVVEKRKVTTETPALTREQFDTLLATIADDFDDQRSRSIARRDYALVYLGGRIGLRRGEAFEMTWGDIRPGRDCLLITIHGKGDTHVTLGVPADVAEVVDAWRTTYTDLLGREPRAADAVFPAFAGTYHAGTRHVLKVGRDGHVRPMDRTTVSFTIKGRMRDAGIVGERYSAHALRATAATIAHEMGADILDISNLMRHRSLDTTRIYIKRANAGVNRAAASWTPSVPMPSGLRKGGAAVGDDAGPSAGIAA